jgi:3-hydroxyisobutyrate dehydrogenase-like beta-hydroxyacid dehydrogenase
MTLRRGISLIGFGEVGQILAADLHSLPPVRLTAWDRLFPVPTSAPRLAAEKCPSITVSGSLSEAIQDSSLVVSAVTAGECVAVATEAARTLRADTYFLDLNSVSPGTRNEAALIIQAARGLYVEASVMSPIAPRGIASPIWLGGPYARDFLPIAHSLGFLGAIAYSPTIGKASAAKMCRSVVVKGIEALLTESLVTAHRHGVEDSVLRSLRDLFPVADWTALARYMISRSVQHGERRAEEMREAARTVAEAGIEPWMSRACVERQQWAAKYTEALEKESLSEMLQHVLAHVPSAEPAQK